MKTKKLFTTVAFLATAAFAGTANAVSVVTFETGQGYAEDSLGVANGSVTNAPFTGQQGWSRSTGGVGTSSYLTSVASVPF